MGEFLQKQELVSFCVCECSQLPDKKDYTSIEYGTKREGMQKAEETRYILPDGSLHFSVSDFGQMAEVSKNKSRIFTPRVKREYKAGIAHGKYLFFRTNSKKEELKAEGEYKRGLPHGTFRYYGLNNDIEFVCTFVKGRVLEFSKDGVEVLVSRNKKNGTVHYVEKNSRDYGKSLKIFRYLFSELKKEWEYFSFSLGIISQEFEKCECDVSIIPFDSMDIFKESFSNKRERVDFAQNAILVMQPCLWIQCPYIEGESAQE